MNSSNFNADRETSIKEIHVFSERVLDTQNVPTIISDIIIIVWSRYHINPNQFYLSLNENECSIFLKGKLY